MRKVLRRAFWGLVTISLVGSAALWVFVLDGSPTVAHAGAPTPEDAVVARSFVREVRVATGSGGAKSERLIMTQDDLNSLIRVASRIIPGLRGSFVVKDGLVSGQASVPVPGTGQSRWLNVSAAVPAFDGGVVLRAVQVGALSVPPGLALELGRLGGNAIFGNDFGTTVVEAASRMDIQDDQVSFDLNIAEMGKNGVMRGLFGALRGAEMPVSDEIDRYYVMIREAMDDGVLPTEGSYLPYLLFTLTAALQDATSGDLANAYTAAIFALTRVCGARDFTLVVGGLAGEDFVEKRPWRTECSDVTFNGRIDSRRHFTTAAALQAASNRGFAASVGEFKELFDTLKSGGFDFTDIAANNSGIRLSNRLMSAPPENWPALIALIKEENDVIIPFDGVPQIMSEEDFNGRFGSIESREYLQMLDSIETKIDDLPIHRAQ